MFPLEKLPAMRNAGISMNSRPKRRRVVMSSEKTHNS